MAVNQGAIQLQIIINNKSLTISKKHLMSLNVKRVIGDSANEFTLEVFDETAYQIENLLIGSNYPSITVKYSASTSFKNTVIFTGMCMDYNTTFTGRAMMLSITGILMTTGDVYDGWWFDKATIEWCGSEIKDYSYTDNDNNTHHEYWIDGKNAETFTKYKDNRDVCAIIVSNEDGGYTTYFNPGRIFQRIIHKYNGDKLGTGVLSSTYSGSYDAENISSIKKSVWDALKKAGYSDVATAAVMGNIECESGFNPSIIEKGNNVGFGLCQWSYGRRTALENYANSINKKPSDLDTQLTFLLAELNPDGGAGGYASYQMGGTSSTAYDGNAYTVTDWKDSNDINKATTAFMALFERPSYDININHLNKRKEKANYYYVSLKTGEFNSSNTQINNSNTLEVSDWGKGGTGKYVIAECDETRWIANLETVQTNETAAQYITRVLCKAAVSNTGKDYVDEVAGFKYWCDAKGHHFKALDYNSKNITSKINVSYGLKESQIISFSISNLGSVAINYKSKDEDNSTKRNEVILSSSAISDLYNDNITMGGENILGANVSQEIISSNKTTLNWYQDTVPAIQIKSSTTESELSANLSNLYNELTEYAISAELTLWGEYSKGYTPGDYIDIIVMTAAGYRHYSSGVYMITSMTDNISGAGYTQTMRLLKMNKNLDSIVDSQAILNPELNIDGFGNIIASYTRVTHIDEHTRAYERLDINDSKNNDSFGGGRRTLINI